MNGFGFVVSYNAVIKIAIEHEKKYISIKSTTEWNDRQQDSKGVRDIIDKDELIIADSAEPKTIQYYNQQGFRMIGAKKGPGSRLQNTKKVKRFRKIICSDECKNTIRELKNLTYAMISKATL